MPCLLLKQSLPSQLDLPRSLSRFESTFAHTCHAAVFELDLVLNFGECAWAVVREVDAAEGVWAEVFVAMCWIDWLALQILVGSEHMIGLAPYRLRIAAGTKPSLSRRFVVVAVVDDRLG